MARAINACIQMLILAAAFATELPAAQRYTDDDWIRLRRTLKATAMDIVNPSRPYLPEKELPTAPKVFETAPDSIRLRVLRYACVLGAPPPLVLGIAEQESQFASVRGQAGELGVMQVMPDSARSQGLDPSRLLDVDYGIYAGIIILLEIMREFPGEETALGVYNGGRAYANDSLNAEARARVGRYIEEVERRKSKYAAYDCQHISRVS